MRDLVDKVAVVTGAASGIGRGLAQRFAAERMRVVLADVEAEPLARAENELRAGGASVLAVRTDVSRAGDVEALAGATLDAFGAVHVLCNNAGVVGTPAASWERSVADWEWILGVNLWGVIHGIRTFVPLMLQHGSEGHIVNTASMAGLISGAGASDYGITKHAVVTLSESLHHELALAGSRLKVSVLCPAWVNTRIMDSERNRPAALARRSKIQSVLSVGEQLEPLIRQLLATGLAPERVAECVVDAIRSERFYILTHPEWKALVRKRMESILEDGAPALEPPL
jgi:NAD(P)-dependent dehydrogenase (short-subunit alcohol dehydrogenase family)